MASPGTTVQAVAEEHTYAFGVLLRLLTTDEGGRTTPLLGGSTPEVKFQYRPNWGLPQMTPPEQTGAPVLAFSREDIHSGEEVRVVIVPPYPQIVSEWASVSVGDELPMYEGSRVRGRGRVLWRRDTSLPLPAEDEERFRSWVTGPPDGPDPD